MAVKYSIADIKSPDMMLDGILIHTETGLTCEEEMPVLEGYVSAGILNKEIVVLQKNIPAPVEETPVENQQDHEVTEDEDAPEESTDEDSSDEE